MTKSNNTTNLVRWHLSIATFFEVAKYAHQIALYLTLTPDQYGTIGTVFATAYLSANLSGLEMGNALVPFAAQLSTHKTQAGFTKKIFIRQATQHLIGSTAAGLFIYKVTQTPILAIAGALIAFSEGLRIDLRPVAYAITDSTKLALIEALIATGYIGQFWCRSILRDQIDITKAVLYYVVASAYGLGYLLIKTHNVLSNRKRLTTPPPTTAALLKKQSTLILLHLPHNLFSANFLVPFFAKSSLILAGKMKFVSEIAGAMRSIIRSAVGYPTHSILTTMKIEEEISAAGKYRTRDEVVNRINSEAKRIIAFIAGAMCIIMLPFVVAWETETILLFLGFCLLTIADYLCIPYEIASIHKNTLTRAATIRGVEAAVSAGAVIMLRQNPMAAVAAISTIRITAWQLLSRSTRREQPPFF